MIYLKELYRQRMEITERISEIETAEHEKESRQYVGRYFKTRNSYSCPQGDEDYWWLYTKITGFEGRANSGFQFQRDNDGRSSTDHRKANIYLRADYVEISRGEWDEAWSCFLSDLQEDEE